jgi:putative NIF3 family GTP cyclohydrolase 1 type 2
MTTTEIMDLALKMAGFEKVPGDSEIFNPGDNIKRLLFGIDIWNDDLVKAKELGADLVISHHPPNLTLGKHFTDVIDKLIEYMTDAGVPLDVAKEVIIPIKEEYKFIPLRTHEEIVSLSKKLKIALMNIHQPCDEIGRKILQSVIDKLSQDKTVRDLINTYSDLDEIKKAKEQVELVCGDLNAKIGKAVVVHGAGTNGGYPVANVLFTHSVNTVVYAHLLPHADRELLKKENKGNLVVTGHHPTDALGINPVIKELELRGIEVLRCNGL